jgi:hypothetical protein
MFRKAGNVRSPPRDEFVEKAAELLMARPLLSIPPTLVGIQRAM